jgi:predicted PurR-regulated permease PerM
MRGAQIPNYIKAVFILMLIIIIIFVMIAAKGILVPLMLGGYIAMVLTPLSNKLELRKIPRSLSSFLALLLFTILFSGIVFFIVTQIQSFLADIENNIESDLNRFAIKVNSIVKDTFALDLGMGYGFRIEVILAMIQSGKANMSALLLGTLDTIATIILLPVFSFFMLLYRDHFESFIKQVFEKQRNHVLLEHITSIRKIVSSYLIGAGKVMLILAVVNTIILLLLGIKHALFFGILAGLLNIIPYLGPMLGAILPFFFALLTKDSLFYPFAVVVSFTIIQFLESIYLTPKITGANVSLNAFVTFVGLLIGGAIWGVVGMILIIPTLAILKKLFELNPATQPYAFLFGEESRHWFKRKKEK